MRYKLVLIAFIFVFALQAVDAATISGSVKDKYGNPVPAANVIIKESKISGSNQYYFSASTDARGKYAIQDVPMQKLTFIAYLGSVSQQNVLDVKNEKHTLDFTLDLAALPEQVVTADRPVLPRVGLPGQQPSTPSQPAAPFKGGNFVDYGYLAKIQEQAKTAAFTSAGVTPAANKIEKAKLQKGCRTDKDCSEGFLCFGGLCTSKDLCQESDGTGMTENPELDGKHNDPFTKAVLIGLNGRKQEDSCVCEYPAGQFTSDCEKLGKEFTHVAEYSCSEEKPVGYVACSGGCFDGQCIPSIEETLEEIRKMFEPEIDTSDIKTHDVLCGFYSGESYALDDSGTSEITGAATAANQECDIVLGYDEAYLNREMQKGGIFEGQAKEKITHDLKEIFQKIIREEFKPLKVKGIKIYLEDKEKVKTRGEQGTLIGSNPPAVYNPKDNTIYFDLKTARYDDFYHEYVHVVEFQLEKGYQSQITEFKKDYTGFLKRVVSSLYKKYVGSPAKPLGFEPLFKDIKNEEDLARFIEFTESSGNFNSPVFGIAFIKAQDGMYIASKELFRYDFIPKYKDFFPVLDSCNIHLTSPDRTYKKTMWDNGKDKDTPQYGAYRAYQCINIREFIATMLESIKYNKGVVYDSLQGVYGDPKPYKQNLDAALKWGWITKEDYDIVVNYNKQGSLESCNPQERAGKPTTGLAKTGEECRAYCKDDFILVTSEGEVDCSNIDLRCGERDTSFGLGFGRSPTKQTYQFAYKSVCYTNAISKVSRCGYRTSSEELNKINLDSLFASLKSESSEEKKSTIFKLKSIRDSKVTDALIPLLDDMDKEVREENVNGLTNLCDYGVLKPLMNGFEKDEGKRTSYSTLIIHLYNALLAANFPFLDDKDAATLLINGVRDSSNPNTRVLLSQETPLLKDPLLINKLLSSLKEDNIYLKRNVPMIITNVLIEERAKSLSPEIVEAFRGLLKDEGLAVRLNTLDALDKLAYMKDPQIALLLEEAFNYPEKNTRAYAALKIAKLGNFNPLDKALTELLNANSDLEFSRVRLNLGKFLQFLPGTILYDADKANKFYQDNIYSFVIYTHERVNPQEDFDFMLAYNALFKRIHEHDIISKLDKHRKRSISYSVFRSLIKKYPGVRESDLNSVVKDNDIILALDNVLRKRAEFSKKIIFDKNTELIVIAHEPEITLVPFEVWSIREFAANRAVTDIVAYQGVESKQPFLGSIEASRGKQTVIWTNVHGSPYKLTLGEGSTISYQELADTFIKRADLQEVTLIIDACVGFDYAENLFSTLKDKKTKSYPNVIAIANKGKLGTGGAFLTALQSLRIRQNNPLLGEHIYRAEEYTFRLEDIAVFYSEEGDYPIEITQNSLDHSCSTCEGESCSLATSTG